MVENLLTSLERILEYSQLPDEMENVSTRAKTIKRFKLLAHVQLLNFSSP